MAANQNDPVGKYYLGICYEQGWGVACNQCKAAQLYSEAAQAGHVAAQFNLAVFFENGLGGLPESYNSASEMYKKCIECGDADAKEALEKLQLKQQSQTLDADDDCRLQYDGGTGRGQQQLASTSSPCDLEADRGHHASSERLDIPVSFPQSHSSPSLLNSPAQCSTTPPSLLQLMKEHLLNGLNVWDIDLDRDQRSTSRTPKPRDNVVKFFIGDKYGDDTGIQFLIDDTPDSSGDEGFKLDGHFGSLSMGQRSCSLMELQTGVQDWDVVPCT
jgi:hypothetical protein